MSAEAPEPDNSHLSAQKDRITRPPMGAGLSNNASVNRYAGARPTYSCWGRPLGPMVPSLQGQTEPNPT
jgi:hypothetical protein